jgi:hypothetical protein
MYNKDNSRVKFTLILIGELRFYTGKKSFTSIIVTFLLIIFLIKEGFIFLQSKIYRDGRVIWYSVGEFERGPALF